MIQSNLFEPPASHAGDPHTSHVADEAHTKSGRRASNCEKVYQVLTAFPGRCTKCYARRLANLDYIEVVRRMSDLKNAMPKARAYQDGRCRAHPTCGAWWPK